MNTEKLYTHKEKTMIMIKNIWCLLLQTFQVYHMQKIYKFLQSLYIVRQNCFLIFIIIRDE